MDPFVILYVLSLLSAMSICINAGVDRNMFNVLHYGAAGDGKTDDSLAFANTWSHICGATMGTPTMIIPKGRTFLVHPITFTGPCKSDKVYIQLSGTIVAPYGPHEWEGKDISKWLAFEDITGLIIDGPGLIDGRGKGWWAVSCKWHPVKGCHSLAPTALRFKDCRHVVMNSINLVNSPQTHVHVWGCQDVNFRSLNINSLGTSPNTDGIHIHDSVSVSIHIAHISTGDDCISIGDQTSNVAISDIYCGPGHGISIGSLGKDGNEVQVENIEVNYIHFNGTTNGARIKTWQVGRGFVRHVQFHNLFFTEVENPIIIDQYYCDVAHSCSETRTGVHISDVSYYGSLGTSKTDVAVNLNCSRNVPCTDLTFENIQLASAVSGRRVISSCNNAHGITKGIVNPKSCLLV